MAYIGGVATRRELMEQEVARLHDEAKALDRDWRRVPWLFAFIVTALPVHYIWGPTASFYTVLFVPCLVITALYLVAVRRAENKSTVQELERQLREMG